MNLIRNVSMTRGARVFCWVALLVIAVVAPRSVAAQDVKFDVVPAVAGPGVARKISISLITGCPPQAVVVNSGLTHKRTLTIRLDQSNPYYCDMLYRQTATVTYTPEAEGDLTLQVVTNWGAYVGETTLHTRAANSDRSQYDLTGMWYDPASYGSGLTFIHGATREDTVFGTWYVYDGQGAPRWYTIQGVQWMAGGLQAVGQLYWTNASSVVCLPPFTGCPVAFSSVTPIAQVSIVMQGPNSARIIAQNPQGVLVTNLIRSIF